MPLYDVTGKVTRTGRLVVACDSIDEAKDAFKEHFTDRVVDGLQLAEEDEPVVVVEEAYETDDVYMTHSASRSTGAV